MLLIILRCNFLFFFSLKLIELTLDLVTVLITILDMLFTIGALFGLTPAQFEMFVILLPEKLQLTKPAYSWLHFTILQMISHQSFITLEVLAILARNL